jgi:hypothetical protein
MPRVTRKEKEQGKGTKPKIKSSFNNPKPGARDGKKTGFKVGPAHAPRDAYLGKGQLTASLYANEAVADKRSKEVKGGPNPESESKEELRQNPERGRNGLDFESINGPLSAQVKDSGRDPNRDNYKTKNKESGKGKRARENWSGQRSLCGFQGRRRRIGL